MTESTKRAIRTAIHGVIAACAAVPIVVASISLPAGKATAAAAVLVGAAAAVSKAINKLEDSGILPSWLK